MFSKLFLSFLLIATFLLDRPNSHKSFGGVSAATIHPISFEVDSSSASNSEEEWAWFSSEEELEQDCDSLSFYHIRGRKCVPYVCPRGNSKRDFETGECLYTSELPEGGEDSGKTEEIQKLEERIHPKWDRRPSSNWMGFIQTNKKGRSLKNYKINTPIFKSDTKAVIVNAGSGKFEGEKGGDLEERRRMLRDRFEAWVHRMKEAEKSRIKL